MSSTSQNQGLSSPGVGRWCVWSCSCCHTLVLLKAYRKTLWKCLDPDRLPSPDSERTARSGVITLACIIIYHKALSDESLFLNFLVRLGSHDDYRPHFFTSTLRQRCGASLSTTTVYFKITALGKRERKEKNLLTSFSACILWCSA